MEVTGGKELRAEGRELGAQASHPGRQVIALAGDGGLAMLLGELITLRQQHLPVKVVVFSNGALSFVELEMKAGGEELIELTRTNLRELEVE